MDTERRQSGGANRRGRQEPLHGQELLDAATDCVLRRLGPRTLARKCRISFREAEAVHAQVSEEIYRRAESRYTPEGLKRLKHALIQSLEGVIEDCAEEVRRSRKGEGGLNTRAHVRVVGAARQLSTMLGFNAPVQVAHTDHRAHALVKPEQMEQVLADPAARAAMIAYEEAVALLPALPVAPDGTPPAPWESN